ncbi:MAG: hydantoinase/oxoprolinase family protein [Alphaproteobacteria bacterium]|nr:hydantoinase/oxoprolinase family protein [Alphaproteobacteria bacterium]
MRFAVDTGGTFTDLIVEDGDQITMYKTATTPHDPIIGLLDSVALAAKDLGLSTRDLLGRGDLFIHGTTRAINAIVTGNTARTAFLTTQGHPDILVFREGGRIEPFNFTVPYPEPYVPRSLTFEVPGRIMADASVREPLDEQALRAVIAKLKEKKVEAVGVCLLWSVVNPAHELRVGDLLAEHLPGVPFTLSHQLNPAIREYRRASSTCIDSSLKPLMAAYLNNLAARLEAAGFSGRVLVVTSQGGVMDARDAARTPIHSINSGPAMAPVAGRHFAAADSGMDTAVVADTGGTTFDVSLVRRGRIPWTRETWIGQPYRGHMTGFPSVDVKSIGAGGGSIAWVDSGGMLHVGPQSAGAVPGPACYGTGGSEATVTDASLVLGYLDPEYFLGGAMQVDRAAAAAAIRARVGEPLGLTLEAAAAAIIELATENMVHAIEDITVNQGIDPATACLIGGGGAAGLNSVLIARRLGCPTVIIPEVGAALSAAGALMSDLTAAFHATYFTASQRFDRDGVNRVLEEIEEKCEDFVRTTGRGAISHHIEFAAEARYPHQVWEIEVPLRAARFRAEGDVKALLKSFHDVHEDVFAICDRDSEIEVVGWNAAVRCRLRDGASGTLARRHRADRIASSRRVYFPGTGYVDASVHNFEALNRHDRVQAPAIIESSFTTVVLYPGSSATVTDGGSLSIDPGS